MPPPYRPCDETSSTRPISPFLRPSAFRRGLRLKSTRTPTFVCAFRNNHFRLRELGPDAAEAEESTFRRLENNDASSAQMSLVSQSGRALIEYMLSELAPQSGHAISGKRCMTGLAVEVRQKSATSDMGPGCVKSPTLNLRVEFLSQFRRCGNRLHRRLLLGEGN